MKRTKWLSKYGAGGKVKDNPALHKQSTDEVPTRNYVPELPAVSPLLYRGIPGNLPPKNQMSDEELSKYTFDKRAQDNAKNDPSVFSPKFYKKDWQGRDWRDKLDDMGTDLQTRANLKNDNWLDDFNPANWVTDMAGNLAKAPKKAQQDNSVMPYVSAIGEPLAWGTAEKAVFEPLMSKLFPKAAPKSTPPPEEPQYGNWAPRSKGPVRLRSEMTPTITNPNPADWPEINPGQHLDAHGYPIKPNETDVSISNNTGGWDPTTSNPWSDTNIGKGYKRPAKLGILGNTKLTPSEQFKRIEFTNKTEGSTATEQLLENANNHQDVMNNPKLQNDIKNVIQERRMRNTLFPGKSDNGLINSLKKRFALEDDDVVRALDQYNPSSPATKYKSQELDEAIKHLNEQSNHYDLIAPKNKPNTFPINERVGFQEEQAKYFSSQPSNEQLINNSSWASEANWKDFGQEMRGGMKQMNLDPANEQEVEIFRKLHMANMKDRALNQYKPTGIDVFKHMSQQKYGGTIGAAALSQDNKKYGGAIRKKWLEKY
jgi:hypothetical protein